MLRLSRSYYLGSGFGVAAVQQAGAAAHSGSGGNAYGASGGSLTEFVRRASNLKRRFRGKSQYEFARGEAQRFLDAEVPKTNVNAWMETGNNAVALSQILGFFEVQPDATLSSLLLNKLVRTAEDSSVDSMTRLHAMAALIAIRPEENYERAFTTVESVLRGGLPTDPMMRWNTLDECARALLRCGRRIPTHLSDQLTSEVMTLMRQTDQSQFPMYQSSLLRVYNWMVRVGREEARSLLYTLVLHTGEFQSYRFSTLMLSCVRHHYSHPLPVELIQKLARTGLQYCVNANGHGAAATVGGVAKMLMTLEPGVNGVTAHDISELNNRFNALLEDYKPRVERFMTVGDKLYWNRSDDITSIAFAYELGGRMRYRSVFTAFSGYVQSEVSRFEPTQLAMATGILRRSHLLSADIADKLSSRVEVVLGELRLAELGHVCATFASLPAPPAWMEEAKAVALRHNYAEAVGLTRLNLAVAFPHVDAFTTSIDYTQLTGRQLVDALPMVLGKAQFEGPVVSALVARLSGSATAASPVGATAASPVGATADRFSPDDMSILLQSGRPQLVHAANAYLYRRFSEAEWDADTLFSLPLVLGKGGPAQDAVKALAAAKTASISPEQFVSLVELLVRVFSDTDASINTFVVTGGQDLLEAELVLARTIVRYLSAVRASVKLHPGEPWLSSLLEKKHFNLSLLSVEEVENLLLSLHAIYGDVSRTPAMQMILSDIVEHCFQPLTEPTEQAARLTVLLVHLQQGLSLPLLSSQTPLVAQVQQSAATYAKDVRDAVLAMPLPTPVPAEKKMGRFTLKHIKAVTAAEEGDNSAPLLDLTLDDPFAYSPITASSAASPDARVAVAAAASVQPSPPPPLAEPVVEAAAVAASSLPPAAATMPQQEPVMHTDHHHHHPVSPPQADKPTSYYAKFFSFMRGDEERESHRPRRTNLPVNNHNAAGATPHATEAEFPGWGAPPTFGAPPTAASTAVDMNSGWGAPTGQDAPTQQYGMPTTAQNAALFSNIFEQQQQQQHAHPTDASYPPASNPEAAASASPTHTAFSSMFTDSNPANSQQAEPVVRVPAGSTDPAARAPTLRNNMVFFDPAAPRGAGAAGAGRPMMMSKKAVMSRMNPNRPPSADDGSAMPAAEARPRHLANKLDFSRPPPSEYTAPPVAAPEVVVAASAATPDSALAPSSSSSPLAWQEAARRVAGISRYTKTKAKTRNQRSLTEWLKNPDKKLDAEPTTTATTSATSTTAAQSGRGKKKDKAAVAEAPAAPAKHAKHAKGGGRGGADSSAKGKKGAKAASAKKAPAKVSKAAKPAAASRASTAKKPAAKKAAAPKAKAKPKPKPAAKKAPAASKKAPAKKPAPKKAAKGKKK